MIGHDIYERSVSGVVIHVYDLCQIDRDNVWTTIALTSQRSSDGDPNCSSLNLNFVMIIESEIQNDSFQRPSSYEQRIVSAPLLHLLSREAW
jgi:hypothetical protein